MGPCWPISRLAQQLPHLRRRRQQPHQRVPRQNAGRQASARGSDKSTGSVNRRREIVYHW